MKRIKLEMVKMVKDQEGKWEGKFEKHIDLSDSYMFRCFEVYRENEINNNELLEGIIKVSLSEENGLNELIEGITYKGERYIELNTTPSGMKIEEHDEVLDLDFKIQSIYIAEKYKDFIEEFEDTLSGGKIKEMEGKNICTNKEYTSKKALGLTGTEIVKYMPSICFVDEFTYNNKEMYSYIKDGKLVAEEYDMSHIINDGGGLMSSKMAEIIKNSIKVDYDVEFAIIRMYHGLAVKGVVLNFDFVKYFKTNYKADTDTFKKENDRYYIKDIFGCWRDIENIDMILNITQAKYINKWDVPSGTRWEETIYPIYKDSKYNDLNKAIYISKINKDPKKLKNRITLNYQVLQNLNVSAEELIEIAKPIIEQYKNVINMKDINYLKLALGDWLTNIEESATITNKLDLIIDRIGEDCLKWRYIRHTIKSQLIKRLNQLAGGKIIVDGEITVGVCDPITYCNVLMTKDRGNNGLSKGEFSQGGQTGERLSYRNPIAYYAEITKINLIEKELLKDYTQEILFINCFDDFLFQKSGADLDGDLFGIVNNKILIDAIIKEEAPFINVDDGDTVKHLFTKKQVYEDIWNSAGNLIGKIAIKNTKLCGKVSSYNTLIYKDGTVKSYDVVRKEYLKSLNRNIDKKEFFRVNNYIYREEDFYLYDYEEEECTWEMHLEVINNLWDMYNNASTELFKKYIKENDIKYICEFTEDEQKKYREIEYKNYKNDFFEILLASQLAIDKPKTLSDIPKWLIKDLNKHKKLYKPRFMHYLGKCECNGKGKISNCKDIINKTSNNVMDKYSAYIVKELINPLKDIASGNTEGTKAFIKAILGDKEADIDERLINIYDENSKAREYVRKVLNGNTKEYNKIDVETFNKIKALDNIGIDVVAATLKKKNATIRFMTLYFWDDYFYQVLKNMESKTDTLIKVEDGEYAWNGEKYKAIKKEKEVGNLSNKEEILSKLEKEGLVKKIRIMKLTHQELSNEAEIKDNELYCKENKIGVLCPEYLDKFNGIYKVSFDWNTKKKELAYEEAKSGTVWLKVC